MFRVKQQDNLDLDLDQAWRVIKKYHSDNYQVECSMLEYGFDEEYINDIAIFQRQILHLII